MTCEREGWDEIDRLALELSRFDLCCCGGHRFRHEGPRPACRRFRLDSPADPLETAVASQDAAGETVYETLTVRRLAGHMGEGGA